MKYSISVIIPVLNEVLNIGPLVVFLLKNGVPAVQEVVVSDGGSTDDTVEAAQAAGAKVVHGPSGRAIQMNNGAKAATGDVLYFVHADTLPPTDFVAHIQQALQNGQSTGCFRYRFDSHFWLLRVNAWFTRFDFMFCQGGDKTYFIPKALFEQLGRYDERMPIMEEYDFLVRAKAAKVPFVVLPVNALVSARKYEHRSWLRIQWANFVVFNAWRWGWLPPHELKGLYQRLLGHSRC